jgi:DNA uptake protein ComE-like DNA-binding protein
MYQQIYISPDGVPVLVHDEGQGKNLQREGYRLHVEVEPPIAPITIETQPLININTAKLEDLVSGLGVSIAIAKSIIESRPYTDIASLAKVKGVDVVAITNKIGV